MTNVTETYAELLLELYDRLRVAEEPEEVKAVLYEQEHVENEFRRLLESGHSTFNYVVYVADDLSPNVAHWRKVETFDFLPDAIARASRIRMETPDSLVSFGLEETIQHLPPHNLLPEQTGTKTVVI
jgi:hypothetical protein